MTTSGLCDFCNAPNPPWMYLTKPFSMDMLNQETLSTITVHDEPGYAACDACAELVDKDDHEGLARRSAQEFIRLHKGESHHHPAYYDEQYLSGIMLQLHEEGFWTYKVGGRERNPSWGSGTSTETATP